MSTTDPGTPGATPGPAPAPRLTVAVLARDEEAVIGPTLQSARAAADELLVVDTGSTDRTRVLAYRHGAKVVQMPWGDDFSAARNRGLDEAACPWVLWLDAGERLADDSARQLREFLAREAGPSKVFLLMAELAPAGPQGSCERMAQARLMPRRTDLRFEGRVRETLQPAMAALGMTAGLAPGRILCHPRRHDPQWKAERAHRRLKIASLENAGARRPPVRLLLCMADALADLGDPKSARPLYLQAAQDSPAGSTAQLEAHYGVLTTYDGDPDAADGQLAACLRALETFPLDAQLLCAVGNYLQGRNQMELAGRAFETAVRHGQLNIETWHLADIADVAATCLAAVLQLQNKDDEAIAVLAEAAAQGGPPRVRRRLLDLYVKRGRADEALRETAALELAPAEMAAMEDAVRGACKAAQDDRLAALGYLQAAYVAGCRDPLCLRWLAVTLLGAGQIDAALPVLRDWQAVEPANPELAAYLEGIERLKAGQPAVQADCAAKPPEPPVAGPRRLRIDPGTQGTAEPVPAPVEGPQSKVGRVAGSGG